MGLLRTIVLGRENGVRSRVLQMLGLRGKPDGASGNGAPGNASGAGRASPPARPAAEPAEKALRLKKEAPKDVTPPEGYEVVLHKDALEAGRIIEIIIGGRAIAVANVEGRYYAIANACAHAEGPLGEGSMDGLVVTCPYHGWQYDVSDGSCKTNAYAKVATYPVEVVRDAVCVKL
jgi:nitrite reductase/ring-hydroxylating ferredoxin subunit